MNDFRFVVLGDTHYSSPVFDTVQGEYPLSEIPDRKRYTQMVKSTLEPIMKKVHALKPDFIISCGDFVEGLLEESEAELEMREALDFFMPENSIPFLIAPGTHEDRNTYRKTVLPTMGERLNMDLPETYFRFDFANCAFFFLDYLDFPENGKQIKWIENELQQAKDQAKRIVVTAHPPLHIWGRHFFNDPEFSRRLTELFNEYPVDLYLGGHTHNQTASSHKTKSGRQYLQLCASTVGYDQMPALPLDEYHHLAPSTDENQYFWGIMEDSAPGFYIVDIKGERSSAKWQSINGNSASLEIPKRGEAPEKISPPKFTRSEKSISPNKLDLIQSASLHIFGIHATNESSMLTFNGHDLGSLPQNASYAARRSVPLGKKAIESIKMENTITIKMPQADEILLGSLMLELKLYSGETIKSTPCPEIFVAGKRFNDPPFYHPKINTTPRAIHNINLNL